MTKKQAEKLVPEKSHIRFAGGKYKVAGVVDLFTAIFIEIYDEPPSLHIDRIKASSVEFVEQWI